MEEYELIFLIDRLARPFLRTKLQAFCNDTASEAWFHVSGNETAMDTTFKSLPQDDFSYQEFWFLHGEELPDSKAKDLKEYALYRPTSFQEINTWFRTLVKNYRWSLVPWGGVHFYKAFAFLTSDKKLKDKFLNASENIVYPYALYQGSVPDDMITRPYNPIISSYRVETALEQISQAIVFEEVTENIGLEVWNACECDKSVPFIVTNKYTAEDALYNWGNVKFTTIHSFHLANGTKLAIYVPQNLDSYLKMCNPRKWSGEALVVFSGTAQTDKIIELMNTIQAPYKYSDLCYLNSFYESADWVYALNRCHVDVNYSLFTTGSRDKLIGIASSTEISLIACF